VDTYVPLISTRATGPLGIAHLPRLWLKMLMASKGKLAEGYRAGKGGFDEAVLDALGLDADDAIAYVAEHVPTYLAFEAWVREHASQDGLQPEAIARLNERILTFPKPEPARSETLDLLGLPDDETVWLGTDLNALEDWHGFHQALLDAG
jgi:hypothetical protein